MEQIPYKMYHTFLSGSKIRNWQDKIYCQFFSVCSYQLSHLRETLLEINLNLKECLQCLIFKKQFDLDVNSCVNVTLRKESWVRIEKRCTRFENEQNENPTKE